MQHKKTPQAENNLSLSQTSGGHLSDCLPKKKIKTKERERPSGTTAVAGDNIILRRPTKKVTGKVATFIDVKVLQGDHEL